MEEIMCQFVFLSEGEHEAMRSNETAMEIEATWRATIFYFNNDLRYALG
jgi:hypothetical protein